MTTRTTLLTPLEIIDAAFSSPVGRLIAALLVAALILATTSRRSRRQDGSSARRQDAGVERQYAAERRGLAVVALMVLVVFLAEFIVRGYLVTGISLPWWRFATPLIVAMIGSATVAALITTRGMPRVTEAMTPTPRRGWRSFSSRRALTGAGVAILLLIVTTVGAGSASSTDDDGRYTMLTIPVPNAPDIDPLRFPFYGWAYGIPVLFGLAALILTTGVLLHLNAARRYQRTGAIAAETVARRHTARDAVTLLTASILVTVAEAWRQIAGVGTVSSLTIVGVNGDLSYETPWRLAALASALRWCAPVLEVLAMAVLLVLAVSALRGQRVPEAASTAQASPSRSLG